MPHAHSFEIYWILQWTHTMWNILAVNNFYIERKNEILKLILKEFVLAQHQQNHHHQQHKSKINKQQKHLRGIFSSSFWFVCMCGKRWERIQSFEGMKMRRKFVCNQKTSSNMFLRIYTSIHSSFVPEYYRLTTAATLYFAIDLFLFTNCKRLRNNEKINK